MSEMEAPRFYVAPTDDAVVLAYVRPMTVHGQFMENLINLVYYDLENIRRLGAARGGIERSISSANIAHARNEVCRRFLELSTAPWLLMLDTDMTFAPDLIERLLEHADEDKAPIVGGLCFTVEENGQLLPTLYDIAGTEERPEFVHYAEFEPEAMFEVAATGAACLLIHRTVLESVRNHRDPKHPERRGFSEAFPWFQETDFYGMRMSEDTTFCLRAAAAGHRIHVNTAVKLGHIKNFEATFERFAAQRAFEYARRGEVQS
jgi:glycosyl transferase family 2